MLQLSKQDWDLIHTCLERVYEDLNHADGEIRSLLVRIGENGALASEKGVRPVHEPTPEERDYIERAKLAFNVEGELEIDDNAVVSKGDDDGAYVEAWAWVPDDEGDQYDNLGKEV